jgi:hypothetical protein
MVKLTVWVMVPYKTARPTNTLNPTMLNPAPTACVTLWVNSSPGVKGLIEDDGFGSFMGSSIYVLM